MARRKPAGTKKDGQIITRATTAEVEAWFEAARRVVVGTGLEPSLSRETRRLLNAWAATVLGTANKGGK